MSQNILELQFFVRGVIVGLIVAVPLGPVGIVCLKRTFASGHLTGLFSGLGISVADVIYSFIAAFGLTAVSGFLISNQLWLRLFGGIVLCFLGLKTFRVSAAPKRLSSVNTSTTSLFGAFLSALLLTLMNPVLILSFAALFASLGLVSSEPNYSTAFSLVVGVFCGSASWWILLSATADRLRLKFEDSYIRKINHISGVLIIGFGLFVIVSAFFI